MASWLTRMLSSSGKSSRSRRAICSGLQARAHRRSCRGPARRPFQATLGPAIFLPSGVEIRPASRSCNTPAASRSWPASPASDDAPRGRRATARSSPDTRSRRCAWPRCAAARARAWRVRARGGARSRAHRDPGRAAARSPHAQRRTGTAPTAASPMRRSAMVACRRPPGTIWLPPEGIPLHRKRRPRSSVRPRSPTRTLADARVAPPAAGLANSEPSVSIAPSAAFLPSQPPSAERCDNRLRPYCTPRSE